MPNRIANVLVVSVRTFFCLSSKIAIDASRKANCVGTAQSVYFAIERLGSVDVDVVVLDLRMPDSVALIEHISNQFSEIKVLVYASFQEPNLIHEALRAGAKGYVAEGADDELVEAIKAVNDGQFQLSFNLLEELRGNSPVEDVDESDREWATVTTERLKAMPRVSLRIFLYLLLGTLALVIPWSLLFKFTVTAESSGKVEPSDKPYQLDAPVAGKVTAVEIEAGDRVEAEQTLLTLNSQALENELANAREQQTIQEKRLKQLKQRQAQEQKKNSELTMQVDAEQAEQKSELAIRQAELNSRKFELEKTQLRLEAAKKRFDRYQQSYEQGALSQDLLANVEELVNEEEQNILQVQVEILEAEANYDKALNALNALVAEGNISKTTAEQEVKTAESEFNEAKSQLKQTQNSIRLLNHQLKEQIIVSPVDGEVFGLTVEQPGSVVAQGEPLVSIASSASQPVFRGEISTKDSGFVETGMPAKIKLDSYSWREHGVLSGKIKWISPTSSTNDDGDEVYQLEIELLESEQQENFLLAYGQTAKAEIAVRERRIISFWLQ